MESILAIFFALSTTQKIQTYQENANNIWHLPYIETIYRPERWANDERLFSNHPKYKEFEKKINIKSQTTAAKHEAWLYEQRVKHLEENFPDEYDLHKKNNYIGDKKLERTQQYFYPKTKIVIHHSAMPTKHMKNKQDIKKHIQEIQELHTFYRNRGDVGYHFLIGKFGGIYEGRAGWPGIIWAHAQFNNFNSIGINLLGNFQEEYPSKKQIESLTSLLIALCKYYDIKPHQQALMHAKSDKTPYIKDFYDDAITYHKVVGQTSCPGEHMEELIPFVKQFVNEYFINFNERQDHNKIIHEIFSGIDLDISKEELHNHIINFKENYKKTKHTTEETRPWRDTYTFLINNRDTKLLLPNTEGEKIIKKYESFLQKISNHKNINKDERNYFTDTFNKYIYFENQFLEKDNNKSRELFFLYLKKLLLIIQNR